MNENIIVPVLGESITEATVSKWLKKSGEKVNADEPIVELETDKVNLEVPSPISGILSEIKTKEGETAQVGELLGVISDTEKENTKAPSTEKKLEKNLNDKKVYHLFALIHKVLKKLCLELCYGDWFRYTYYFRQALGPIYT